MGFDRGLYDQPDWQGNPEPEPSKSYSSSYEDSSTDSSKSSFIYTSQPRKRHWSDYIFTPIDILWRIVWGTLEFVLKPRKISGILALFGFVYIAHVSGCWPIIFFGILALAITFSE